MRGLTANGERGRLEYQYDTAVYFKELVACMSDMLQSGW